MFLFDRWDIKVLRSSIHMMLGPNKWIYSGFYVGLFLSDSCFYLSSQTQKSQPWLQGRQAMSETRT